MTTNTTNSRRMVAVALLAGVLLIGLFIATGGSLPGGGSAAISPTATASSGAQNPPVAPTTPSSGKIQGTIAGTSRKISGALWQFSYTIRNTGKVPIAGLQINGPTANLYALTRRSLWNAYGTGICHHGPPGILLYWSTGSTSPSVIKPGQTATLSFKTHTKGTLSDTYSFSWGSATPQFGRVIAPAASQLPSPEKCTATP